MELSLLQRILIVAHCGAQGHRGIEPMMSTLTEFAGVPPIFESLPFMQAHERGNIFPRPWGSTYDAKERNELLHFDYL
ncbi:hypothetical protein PHMEG_00014177 [Phytophthora megakarya]|uniref:Uncharacterized protein n=1 Tax=Phytophthora megakarya TaxID=4795 RepID=A0A225W642_9STRA|nr:hypothetical protein PHMEG_00014177 [Phytophthora megakarya]